ALPSFKARCGAIPSNVPEQFCKCALLGPRGRRIDCCRAEACMTHPALSEIEGHAGLQRPNAKCMPQTAWTGLASHDASASHHLLDKPPRRYAMPWPKTKILASRVLWRTGQMEVPIKRNNECGRDRHLAHRMLAPLQGSNCDYTTLHLKRCGGEREDFTHARPCPCKRESK